MNKRFKRARKPEQKEIRRSHLLETAKGLLEKNDDLDSLSLNEIARSSGMAKANVYRYFETREALLLDLLWQEWQDWFEEFQQILKKKNRLKKMSFESLIQNLSGSISERPLLCALTTALPSVLEKNLTTETIRDFKVKSLEFFGEIANFLESHNSEMSSKEYALFLQDTVTIIAGLYPFAAPSKVVANVVSDPKLHFYKRNLKSELERYMMALALSLRNHETKTK